jgi:hypothetical protein
MQDFLLQIDHIYYRSVLLLVARAELERLRDVHATCPDTAMCKNLTEVPESSDGARFTGPYALTPSE